MKTTESAAQPSRRWRITKRVLIIASFTLNVLLIVVLIAAYQSDQRSYRLYVEAFRKAERLRIELNFAQASIPTSAPSERWTTPIVTEWIDPNPTFQREIDQSMINSKIEDARWESERRASEQEYRMFQQDFQSQVAADELSRKFRDQERQLQDLEYRLNRRAR